MFGDEIIFNGAYKELKLGVRYDLKEAEETDVAHALGDISEGIEGHAYRLSGIDTKLIDDFASMEGEGLASICNFLEERSSEWTKTVKESLKDPKLMPVAESYLFNRLLPGGGVEYRAIPRSSIEPEQEEISDTIAFIGRYKGWMAIKKLGLEKVKDYEVSGILSGINHTVINKGFDFAGIERDDDLVKKICAGKRKSYKNVALALRDLESNLTGGPADAYLVCKVLEGCGFPPYATPGMLTAAYPDIKPPKVRGRKPKG